MDLENFICKMGKNIKDNLLRVKNMVREFIRGKMETDMKGSSHMIKDKVQENITGVMEDFIKGNGKQTE